MSLKNKNNYQVGNNLRNTTPQEPVNGQILDNIIQLKGEVGALNADMSRLKEDVGKLMPSYNELAKKALSVEKRWVLAGKVLTFIITAAGVVIAFLAYYK